jgi:hypothetical protein
MAGFAHAGDDHAPGCGGKPVDGLAKALAETGSQRQQASGFRAQHVARHLKIGQGCGTGFGKSCALAQD